MSLETITETLTADHRRCDRLLSIIEHSADRSDWQHIRRETKRFADAMEGHFSFEEDILCSTLESASPMAAGLTGMMRKEHMQIRLLLKDLLAVTQAGNPDQCAEVIKKLHSVVEQHCAKEEGVLYSLFDRAFGARWTDVVQSHLAD